MKKKIYMLTLIALYVSNVFSQVSINMGEFRDSDKNIHTLIINISDSVIVFDNNNYPYKKIEAGLGVTFSLFKDIEIPKDFSELDSIEIEFYNSITFNYKTASGEKKYISYSPLNESYFNCARKVIFGAIRGQMASNKKIFKDNILYDAETYSTELQDNNGNVIIPKIAGYDLIVYNEGKYSYEYPFYEIYKKGNDDICYIGACNLEGKEVVPPAFVKIQQRKQKGFYFFEVSTIEGYNGIYSYDGKVVVEPKYKGGIQLFGSYFKAWVSSLGKFIKVSNKLSTYLTESTEVNKSGSDEIDDADLRENANKFESEGKYKKAIAIYNKLINVSPSAELYYHRASCQYNIGKWKKAQEDLRVTLFRDDCSEDLRQAATKLKDLADSERIAQIGNRDAWWDSFANALTIVGSTMTNVAQSVQGSNSDNDSYSNIREDSHSYPGTSSSAHRNPGNAKACTICRGSGKCMGYNGKYKCFGTGKCKECGGKKYTYAANGEPRECTICHSTGKCPSCGGSGKCKSCGGKGY